MPQFPGVDLGQIDSSEDAIDATYATAIVASPDETMLLGNVFQLAQQGLCSSILQLRSRPQGLLYVCLAATSCQRTARDRSPISCHLLSWPPVGVAAAA